MSGEFDSATRLTRQNIPNPYELRYLKPHPGCKMSTRSHLSKRGLTTSRATCCWRPHSLPTASHLLPARQHVILQLCTVWDDLLDVSGVKGHS